MLAKRGAGAAGRSGQVREAHRPVDRPADGPVHPRVRSRKPSLAASCGSRRTSAGPWAGAHHTPSRVEALGPDLERLPARRSRRGWRSPRCGACGCAAASAKRGSRAGPRDRAPGTPSRCGGSPRDPVKKNQRPSFVLYGVHERRLVRPAATRHRRPCPVSPGGSGPTRARRSRSAGATPRQPGRGPCGAARARRRGAPTRAASPLMWSPMPPRALSGTPSLLASWTERPERAQKAPMS